MSNVGEESVTIWQMQLRLQFVNYSCGEESTTLGGAVAIYIQSVSFMPPYRLHICNEESTKVWDAT